MQNPNSNSTHTFRLGWKGILSTSEWLLYADSDTSALVVLPLFLLLFLPRLFFSYLRLSTQGVELHYWPNYTEQFPWNTIVRLGKCRTLGVINCDALYLHNSLNNLDTIIISRSSGLHQKRIIPVSDFQGWPNGRLAKSLAVYIPGIIR